MAAHRAAHQSQAASRSRPGLPNPRGCRPAAHQAGPRSHRRHLHPHAQHHARHRRRHRRRWQRRPHLVDEARSLARSRHAHHQSHQQRRQDHLLLGCQKRRGQGHAEGCARLLRQRPRQDARHPGRQPGPHHLRRRAHRRHAPACRRESAHRRFLHLRARHQPHGDHHRLETHPEGRRRHLPRPAHAAELALRQPASRHQKRSLRRRHLSGHARRL